MKTEPLYLFAKWQVKEGKLDEVLPLMSELQEKSRAEEGNLLYKVHQSMSDNHMILLYESYVSEKALDDHRGSEHFKALAVQQIIPLLESREALPANELVFTKG